MERDGLQDWKVRRMSDGSIDYTHYVRVSQALRREALQQALAVQGQAFAAVFGPIGTSIYQLIRIPSVTVCSICARVVHFWNIPPLGSSDLH